MFDKIRLSWLNGFSNPTDEYEYAFKNGYYLCSTKEHNNRLSNLKKLPNNYTGFIEDEYFFGRTNVARETCSSIKVKRDIEEINNAFDYVQSIPVTFSLDELLESKVTAKELGVRKLVILLFEELLVRNRQVELLLSEDMTELVLSKFNEIAGFDFNISKILSISEECYDYKVSKKELNIIFDGRINLHPDTFR